MHIAPYSCTNSCTTQILVIHVTIYELWTDEVPTQQVGLAIKGQLPLYPLSSLNIVTWGVDKFLKVTQTSMHTCL